jgi:hypothetical protein
MQSCLSEGTVSFFPTVRSDLSGEEIASSRLLRRHSGDGQIDRPGRDLIW